MNSIAATSSYRRAGPPPSVLKIASVPIRSKYAGASLTPAVRQARPLPPWFSTALMRWLAQGRSECGLARMDDDE